MMTSLLYYKVLRIKTAYKVAWVVLILCMAIPLVYATVASAVTASIVTVAALVGVMAYSAAALGGGAAF